MKKVMMIAVLGLMFLSCEKDKNNDVDYKGNHIVTASATHDELTGDELGVSTVDLLMVISDSKIQILENGSILQEHNYIQNDIFEDSVSFIINGTIYGYKLHSNNVYAEITLPSELTDEFYNKYQMFK